MKFKKVFSDKLIHCYAVLHLQNADHDYLIVASEEDAACYAYNLDNHYEKTTVWENIGGTMTMVQIPNTLDFLATQRFYPGFNASQCIIVREHFNGIGWDKKVVGFFPYVHRFDIVPKGPHTYWFVGCSIANSKKSVDDWSDPGKIWIGEFNDTLNQIQELRALDVKLFKNHGYYRVPKQNFSFITAEEGIFKLNYPSSGSDWVLEKVSDTETSDIAMCDVDNDGKSEFLTIEGFHGPYLSVLNACFEPVIHTEPLTPFGHAIWGGQLEGEPGFIFGYRAGNRDLLWLTLNNSQLKYTLIDKNVGSSNVLTYFKNHESFILSANRESSEIAVYLVSNG
ncbi:hypothetical protein [Secundilactobacillus mixtipabuli]|uniref:VCBS repeat-containing protein n=1 Tax=Secundilactobacillus mixtipabuli TaxID=1435342 RepID=A0A1Z5IA48_9LACO|nr:hypothetical protein [Secundilactobacillus mixtipabuli]GAW98507.1 hypothetical protein IWT30_00452 [Secundilactobacillus mixtipabuli]